MYHKKRFFLKISRRGVFCDTGRHSCEGRNPENSVPSKLDSRLRGMTNKTPRPFIQIVSTSSAVSWAYNIGKVFFRSNYRLYRPAVALDPLTMDLWTLNLRTVFICLSSHLLECIDQAIGRRIMGIYAFVIFYFRQNIVGQLFAEFDAPLVEWENVPDNSLDKYFVFVHGN